VYEHALTITAWQQIYDQLHPGQFRGEFTEILLDEIQVFANIPGWRCASPAWSGRTPSGLVFRRPGASRGLLARSAWAGQKSPPVPAVRSSSSARRMITPFSV
jgi:hypothetical protein